MERIKLIKFKITKFFLLPSKPENVVLNTFINATIKTFGFIVALQALTFVYWKRKFPVGRMLRLFMFKHWLTIPFFYYWYRKLKASSYQELDKLNITITPIVKANEAINKSQSIDELTSIPVSIESENTVDMSINKSVEEAKTSVKDKIRLSYVLE
jgi:hypothetical protein